MCPFLWYLQSAVGFEYQGKTEKHASQRGKPGRRERGRALSLEEVSWGGPCSLSVQCHHGASQAATEAAFCLLSGIVLGESVLGVAGHELTAPSSGNRSPLSSLMLYSLCGPHTAPMTFESCCLLKPLSESGSTSLSPSA